MRSATYTIIGDPVSQKNSKAIGRRGKGGALFLRSNSRVLAWKESAALQLAEQLRSKCKHFGKGISLEVVIQARMGKGRRIDIDNLASAPLDALQAAGIIHNDGQIDILRVERTRATHVPHVTITIHEGCPPPEDR